MAKERLELIRLNIARFRRLLETETDQVKRLTMKRLLAEAQCEAMQVGQEQARERPTHPDGDAPNVG
jgi:hypothetical protein